MRHKPWRVAFLPQLPQLRGKDEHHYEHFGQARDFAKKQLEDWKGWCKRYNTRGLVVIDEMQDMIAGTEAWFYQNPGMTERIIEGLLDDHTQTTVRVRIRKVKP